MCWKNALANMLKSEAKVVCECQSLQALLEKTYRLQISWYSTKSHNSSGDSILWDENILFANIYENTIDQGGLVNYTKIDHPGLSILKVHLILKWRGRC